MKNSGRLFNWFFIPLGILLNLKSKLKVKTYNKMIKTFWVKRKNGFGNLILYKNYPDNYYDFVMYSLKEKKYITALLFALNKWWINEISDMDLEELEKEKTKLSSYNYPTY